MHGTDPLVFTGRTVATATDDVAVPFVCLFRSIAKLEAPTPPGSPGKPEETGDVTEKKPEVRHCIK